MQSEELKIPKERIAVLIGKKGESKRLIEKKAKAKIDVDSKAGDVIMTGEDPISLFVTKHVVQAIGRGFSPEKALMLFDESYTFEIVDVTEFTGKSKKKMERMRGRVIGEKGKSRNMIENLTDTYVSVYGKTVGIIGYYENAAIARGAVEMLLSGSPHGNVYRWLEDKRRELQKRQFEENAIKADI
ncbi:MAG: KH domain-containing protein [Candidatus Woesearchaeota archaeon]